MTEIVYNDSYGGFSLFGEAEKRYRELGGDVRYTGDIPRTDPILIQVVEECITKNEDFDIQIRDVPEGSKYRIDEYDGLERVVLIDEYDWLVA